MATYYVWDGGSNGAGTDWTSAKTTLAGAIALASASGDAIKVAHTHTGDNALAVDTTWTVQNHIGIVSVDKGNSDAPTQMGTEAWIGSSSASISLTITGGYRVKLSGLTLRNGGSTSKAISFATSDGNVFDLEDCYLWRGTNSTSAAAGIQFGAGSTLNCDTTLKNCTLRFGSSNPYVATGGNVTLIGCIVSSDGVAPSTLFNTGSAIPSTVTAIGCDFSYCGSNTLVANNTGYSSIFKFVQCKLGTNYVARAAPSSPTNAANAQTWIIDCSSGDTHGLFGYYDGQGALTSDTGVYVTSGAAQQS